MAVRLSVIMVHSPPPTSTAQQLAQGVVGELIGLPGIDLTLVEPLDRLQATSTDRLTLGVARRRCGGPRLADVQPRSWRC